MRLIMLFVRARTGAQVDKCKHPRVISAPGRPHTTVLAARSDCRCQSLRHRHAACERRARSLMHRQSGRRTDLWEGAWSSCVSRTSPSCSILFTVISALPRGRVSGVQDRGQGRVWARRARTRGGRGRRGRGRTLLDLLEREHLGLRAAQLTHPPDPMHHAQPARTRRQSRVPRCMPSSGCICVALQDAISLGGHNRRRRGLTGRCGGAGREHAGASQRGPHPQPAARHTGPGHSLLAQLGETHGGGVWRSLFVARWKHLCYYTARIAIVTSIASSSAVESAAAAAAAAGGATRTAESRRGRDGDELGRRRK